MSFGFLNVDKPAGMTSHDVVNRIRRIVGTRQVGHAGTLDPMATGVLIICVGAATRLSEYVMSEVKVYRAIVHLGVETDTYDADGTVLAELDPSDITLEHILATLPRFQGEIHQRPPAYSAIKQGGHKLYELARKGKIVEVPPRPVTIHAIDILNWASPRLTVEVTCSAGTYIRSLAHDLGEALGVGAHLAGLARTTSGEFQLADAIVLDTLIAGQNATAHLIPPTRALRKHPRVTLDLEAELNLRHGRAAALSAEFPDGQTIMAFDSDDQLVAVCNVREGSLRPAKVFADITPADDTSGLGDGDSEMDSE
ncbi:MAG: tRNA pseudouridine(55) synthase TruB [Chloroflexi bacterium]|nr:tRNA pseudouridine(55) synthase TruB [Chloroflexota bacterium]